MSRTHLHPSKRRLPTPFTLRVRRMASEDTVTTEDQVVVVLVVGLWAWAFGHGLVGLCLYVWGGFGPVVEPAFVVGWVVEVV